MQADPRRADAAAPEELLNPAYWLVFGLEWPGAGDGGMAEAALAVAPGMIPRELVSRDSYQVLGCADLYARKHAGDRACRGGGFSRRRARTRAPGHHASADCRLAAVHAGDHRRWPGSPRRIGRLVSGGHPGARS